MHFQLMMGDRDMTSVYAYYPYSIEQGQETEWKRSSKLSKVTEYVNGIQESSPGQPLKSCSF